ncbi:flagellar protein FlaG [Colwelliaceae bacterium 6471]
MNIELQSAISAQEVSQVSTTDNAKSKRDAADNVSKDDLIPHGVYTENTKAVTEETKKNIEESEAVVKELSKAEIKKVAQQLQEFVKSLNRNVSFSVDEDSGRDVISVVEVKSGELIRQIPSEEILKLASRISKAAGLIVQEEV